MRLIIHDIVELGRVFMPVFLGIMVGAQLHSAMWGLIFCTTLCYLDPREAHRV